LDFSKLFNILQPYNSYIPYPISFLMNQSPYYPTPRSKDIASFAVLMMT